MDINFNSYTRGNHPKAWFSFTEEFTKTNFIQHILETTKETDQETVRSKIKCWIENSKLSFDKLVDISSLFDTKARILEIDSTQYVRCKLTFMNSKNIKCQFDYDDISIDLAVQKAEEEGIDIFVYYPVVGFGIDGSNRNVIKLIEEGKI